MTMHGGFSQNSIYMDEHTIITKPIKVMVVDNNKRFLYVVGKVLNYFGFEVTAVDHGGTALAILSKRLENFDLVLIDSNLSDVDAHTFLRITKHIDIQAILMSKEDDDQTLLKAFKDGALLVIKRPLTGDKLSLLRQHAIRKRLQNLRNYNMPNNCSCVAYLGNMKPTNSISLVPNIGNPNVASAYSWIMKKEPMIYDDEETTCESTSSERKRKTRMTWTPELHAKFMDAIGHLGEGRCVPKLIHEVMGIPGITRAQVSSHLQATQRKMENRKA